MFAFLTPLTGCYTTNQNQIDGYGYYRWGSNSYNVWNIDSEYLNSDDSKCVTKTESISIDNQIKNKTTKECIEVMNLGKDRYKSKMFSQILDNFFNSPSGMVLISELIQLL